MKSMTGFGRGAAEVGSLRLLVELQTVNKRGLEVSVSYPREWGELEIELPRRVQEVVQRGKVQGQIRVLSKQGGAEPDSPLDLVAADRAWEQLERLAHRYRVAFKPDLHTLVEWMRFSLDKGGAPALGEMREALWTAIAQALAGVDEMRRREGEALRKDMQGRVESLVVSLREIRGAAPQGVVRYRDELLRRLEQMEIAIDLEDERLLRELALFAERSDITEELTRLGSHLEQLQSLLDLAEPIGRRLEFILQEIHRELNTMGSKSSVTEVSRLVIEAKHEVDRLREQSLNVE